MDPFKAVYSFLDFDNCCVAGDTATTLIRETRFPHSKEEHTLLLDSLRTRTMDIYCFDSIELKTAYNQLKDRLALKNEFVTGSGALFHRRASVVTKSLGRLLLHAARVTLACLLGNEPLPPTRPDTLPLSWILRQMRQVATRFQLDQSKCAYVVYQQNYLVYDGDHGRAARMCCYCPNDKVVAQIKLYQQRGHLIDLLQPDPSYPFHFACKSCVATLNAEGLTTPTYRPHGETVYLPARYAYAKYDGWPRSCSHGPCIQSCLPDMYWDLIFVCTVPVQSSSVTCQGNCCWGSPFIPAAYGYSRRGLPVRGQGGESLRDKRMADLKFNY
jgi:hypothetical protein